MFTQRALSIQVMEADEHYCWLLKENQPTLYRWPEAVVQPPADPRGQRVRPDSLDFVVAEQCDKGYGRREYRCLTASSLLAGYSDWPYLAKPSMWCGSHGKTRWSSREERYGITSAPATTLSATRILEVVRRHWRIENGLHYRRDVSLAEDVSQVRIGQIPHILASLNNAVCGLIVQAGITNLVTLQRTMATQLDRALFRV